MELGIINIVLSISTLPFAGLYYIQHCQFGFLEHGFIKMNDTQKGMILLVNFFVRHWYQLADKLQFHYKPWSWVVYANTVNIYLPIYRITAHET